MASMIYDIGKSDKRGIGCTKDEHVNQVHISEELISMDYSNGIKEGIITFVF